MSRRGRLIGPRDPVGSQALEALALVAVAVASIVGCASEEPEPGPLPIGQWTELVAGDWTLEPGEEKYICAKKTLSHAAHVNGFRPIAPAGTHHTVLSVTSAPGPDGVAPCNPAVDGHQILFATGLGTSELSLPEGVAATVPAGTQLLLSLHLVNATPQALSGRSGTSGFLMAAASVEERAEVVLAGKIDGLEVVPGASTQTGLCTFAAESTLFAVMPHMHERGRHLRVASGSDVVYDQDFDVDTQSYALVEPPRGIAAGEQLTIECSYENPSAETLHFGPFASDEMCYAMLVRFPALGASRFCTN